MSNIIQANLLIRGTRPMLIHHFGADAIPLERRERSGVAGNDPEEWKRTVLMTDLPPPANYLGILAKDSLVHWMCYIRRTLASC